MPSCEFKAFKASNSKVKFLAFHPTEPWLAFADKGYSINVLEWTTQQVILEAPVGVAEEYNAVEASLQRLAERDPSFYGSPLGAPVPKLASSGIVKDLCFLDPDVCFWQLAQQHLLQFKACSSASIPQIGKAWKARAHKWLVTACESKVLLQDLTSTTTIDVPRSGFESRTPSCLAVLYLNSSKLLAGADGGSGDVKEDKVVSPVIAVGTTSGCIFLLAVQKSQCVLCAKLAGGHKATVTKLVAIGGKDASSPERLVSAGADGTVALWDPSSISTSKDVAPVATTKPHDSEIFSMVVSAATADSLDGGGLRLVTSGEDKRVAFTDLPGLTRQVLRWKPLPKGSIDGLASNPWAQAGSQLVAISGERASLFSLPMQSVKEVASGIASLKGTVTFVRLADGQAQAQEAQQLLSLDAFLPAGTKRAAKVYTVASHPLRPDVIAIGANTGVGIIGTRCSTVPAAALPAGSEAGTAGSPFQFLYATDSRLWRLSYRASWSLEAANRQLGAEQVSKASIASTGRSHQGTPELCLSPDGRHCSLVWPTVNRFAVYSSEGADVWKEVQSGSGSSVAWSSRGRQFAVLHLPQVSYPEVKKGKTKKSKAREEEAAVHAASLAASLAAQEGGDVKTYSISPAGGESELTDVRLPSDRPRTLFGGPLLAVVSSRTITREQRRGSSMQFFSWATGQPVGAEMLAPKWIAWEPRVTAVALGYAHAVVLCRTQPSVTPIATLPLKNATAAAWHHKLLLISSASEIHGVFVSAGRDVETPFIESVKIASLAGGVISQAAAGVDSTAPLPPESMRCVGPCAIGGVREGVLWLVDSRGAPFMIPLLHAGLRGRIAAAQGELKTARAVAESGIPKALHDGFAHFVSAIDPQAGLEEALALSGISIETELKLSRKAAKFRRALRCLQAMAMGADDAAAFREFPSWNTHLSESTPLEAAPAPREPAPLPFLHLIQHTRGQSIDAKAERSEPRRSVLAFIAADNVDEESSEDEELVEQAEAIMGMQQAPTEAIDWDALLTTSPPTPKANEAYVEAGGEAKVPDSSETVASANGVPAANGGNGEIGGDSKHGQEAAVSEEEQKRIAGLMGEGLLLVDTALGHGHEDVAKAALRTLLRGTGKLGPGQLQALLVRCSQCKMGAEIKAFASRIVTDGTGASPETSSLVAALVNDPALARSVLRASGMVPLSAIYSHTWKHGNSLQDINDWGSFLTAAAGNSVQFGVVPPTM